MSRVVGRIYKLRKCDCGNVDDFTKVEHNAQHCNKCGKYIQPGSYRTHDRPDKLVLRREK